MTLMFHAAGLGSKLLGFVAGFKVREAGKHQGIGGSQNVPNWMDRPRDRITRPLEDYLGVRTLSCIWQIFF